LVVCIHLLAKISGYARKQPFYTVVERIWFEAVVGNIDLGEAMKGRVVLGVSSKHGFYANRPSELIKTVEEGTGGYSGGRRDE
jgi:hypothetical protein